VAFLIGTDEAGYAPNLGPLVISATVWQVDDCRDGQGLYERLAAVVQPAPVPLGETTRLAVGDSKLLYRPGSGLAGLERGVLACMRQCGMDAISWRAAWAVLCPDSRPSLDEVPWYVDFDRDLPIDTPAEILSSLAHSLQNALSSAGVALRMIRSVAIFPYRFNDQVQQLGSKGQLLSHSTIKLACDLLADCDGDVLIQCDKHGGRNRYGPLLQRFFPDVLVRCHGEGRAISTYRWDHEGRQVEARFITNGESFLPSALASMASKYLRELAMIAFNRYWTAQLPDIRPTAGYPVDARRFKAEIAARQRELGIDDRLLWRCR
jgi:hypothetical protein